MPDTRMGTGSGNAATTPAPLPQAQRILDAEREPTIGSYAATLHGQNAKSLSKKTGLSEVQVTAMLRGHTAIGTSRSETEALAKACGCSAEELYKPNDVASRAKYLGKF